MTGLSLRAHLTLMMATTHHMLLSLVKERYFPSFAYLKRSPGCQHRQQQQYQDLHDSHESGHRTNGISRYMSLSKTPSPVKPIVMLCGRKSRACVAGTCLVLDRAMLSDRISGVMHLAVITGYVMASLFALCGLFNTVQFCIYGSYANVGDFIRGLVIVLHPLAVATVILLLAQLLCRQGQPRTIADVMHHRHPQKHPEPTRAGQGITPRKMPERYFPIPEETPASAPAETNPDTAPDTTQEEAPEPEEKLQFFKLH